jgi:hypothetical protein
MGKFLVVVLGLAVAAGISVLPASAATSASLHPAGGIPAAAVNVSGHPGLAISANIRHFRTNNGDVDCMLPNKNYNYPSSITVTFAESQCLYRVWMHQYVNYVNHGWATCVSPGQSKTYNPAIHPENIQVTSNTNSC